MTETGGEEDSPAPPRENDRCDVRFRNGEYMEAVVVAARPLGHRKRKKDLNLPDVSTLSADKIEYYVHYLDHDRRLDEWVTIERFQLDTLKRHEPSEELLTDTSERQTRRRASSSNHHVDRSGDNGIDGNNNGDNVFTFSGGNWHGSGSGGDPALAAFEREHEEQTKVKNIEKVIMGDWEMEAWYYSPFPEAYCDLETLYVCEYCLSYMKKVKTLRKHMAECKHRKPPGKEIYREDDLSVFEVDGKDHRLWCQKLCLLAKMFLDHKTLLFDTIPFRFYVVTKVDSRGAHIVGYFSKEKHSQDGYNLACILTFPPYQKMGFGKFIISLSYLLTVRENKTGSPEKPLSDLGKVSYRSYWTHVVFHLLAAHDPKEDISINDISSRTGIKTEDLISTLQQLDMIKVWKGQHVIYVKQEIIEDYMKQNKQFRLCKPECLTWTPPEDNTSEQENGSSNQTTA